MAQTLFTIFSVVFLVWVVFGPAFNDTKDDKKKSDNGGGGLFIGLLFAPFVLIGWLLFGLGQMLFFLLQALAALWEAAMPFFRKLFEMIGALLEWLWELTKKVLGNVGPFLKNLIKTVLYALRTLWNAIEGILRAFTHVFRSLFSFVGDLIRDFPGLLRTLRTLLKPFMWLLNILRDALGKILSMPFAAMAGILAWMGNRNKRAKEYISRDIEEADPTQSADLLLAVPLAVATGAKRTKKKLKETKDRSIGLFPRTARLAATNPLKKGIAHKRRSNDPHVMARLRHIGWETRRKMGKA